MAGYLGRTRTPRKRTFASTGKRRPKDGPASDPRPPASRYRLVPREENWEGPLFAWEAEDRDGHRVPITAKSYGHGLLKSLLARNADVVDDNAPTTLAGLVRARCERERLHTCLVLLAVPQPLLPVDAVRKAAASVQKAAEVVFQVELSAVAAEVDPEGSFAGLSNVLFAYARRLEWLGKTASRRNPTERNGILASLVRHVKDRTNRWHDEEVAILVAAATGDEWYTAEAHTAWRHRHAGLLGRPTAIERGWDEEVAQRTATARRLWNNRGKRFLMPTALQAARRLYPDLGWRVIKPRSSGC